VFNWLRKLFRRTEIPHRAEVERIAAEVLASGYGFPCARIAARVTRLYLSKGLDAAVETGLLPANDRRVKRGQNRMHAVVVVALGKTLWQLDATTTPMRWTRMAPVWQASTQEIVPRNEIADAKPGSIWW
jgi:hypothetical protein